MTSKLRHALLDEVMRDLGFERGSRITFRISQAIAIVKQQNGH